MPIIFQYLMVFENNRAYMVRLRYADVNINVLLLIW